MKNKYLNSILIFLLLVDSGGGLYLRVFAISFILLLSIFKLFRFNQNINVGHLQCYLIFILSLFPSLLISLIANTPLIEIFKWVISFFLIPFFYLYSKFSNLSIKDFIIAGLLFSILIIVIFLGRVLNVEPIIEFNNYIENNSAGFFGSKNYISGDILPNVYFQGTLGLVICGVLSLSMKSKLIFWINVVSLILAPSRFGFIVLIFSYLFLLANEYKFGKAIIFIPIFFFLVLYSLKSSAFGKEIFSIFTDQSDAIQIRNGHLYSILNIFISQPLNFIFGSGPGTVFYTIGTSSLTDNIEISQLEYIRKYGILSFVIFLFFYFKIIFLRSKDSYFIKAALISYFFVSFSNPVLFSIFSMFFLSFAIENTRLNNS